ncbi:16S rRNA (cytosine(1402)-N(4))-methyltransferase RsmH [Phormidium sp. LEGE 05292]|uniref:16S rRNA (cytosine(1402)-N(4))-methyltransferase RsmH n=1 Tax=[Phormidium] sp. LEGE 05292 TaxID=767427 RepID=UPI0018805C11|nr:16S rRNA (cytosine(1402)-N(4))-methyltransferase RsmH [Phormidium sp. LEGE 05292]MBE9224245.1 16S rRNA (cytosine(1402)-N(4))-methyltransferase RsmH [Phormidium sp. LEGE 05292]
MNAIDPSDTNQQTESTFVHVSVLADELISGLAIHPGGIYLDATVGGGGHTQLILQAASDIKVVAIDRDAEAINAAKNKLAEFTERITFWHGNFATYQPQNLKFDGIIADLGVSSFHLDTGSRGFSFRQEAELDMRMDQRENLTAAEIINEWSESELADIFYKYGEERLSRRIAKQIVEKRPFKTTTELANEIFHSVPRSYRYGRIHPATRVFQALRIVVNQELGSLETFLKTAPNWLKSGGRIGIITFHSLEDRLVKHSFKESAILQVITKKPIIPQEQEIQRNTRSRSAKLRIAEKLNIDI